MTDWVLTTKKIGLSVCVLMVLVLAWQWFSLGKGHSNRQALPEELQEFPPSSAQNAIAVIIEHNLWEPERKSGPELEGSQQNGAEVVVSAVEKNWQLIAVAQVGTDLIAYIRDASDPASLEQYGVGENLPDGKKILKIEQDSVVYSIENEATNEASTNEKGATKQLFLFGRTAEIGEETSE